MAKAVVVYESKYGNTKLADVDYDVILIGSPNHFGGPTRGIRKFIDKLVKLPLNGKLFAVFDTHIGEWAKDFEKAVKKMEKRISEKAPELKQTASGLSTRVQGMKGPITESELHKCKEFGNKITTQIKA